MLPQPSSVCTDCGSVADADGLHVVFECPALQAVGKFFLCFSTDQFREIYFAKQDHMQVVKFVLDCLDVFQV